MWSGLGARLDGRSLYDELVSRYSEPHRRYHSLQHLAECITWFEAVAELAAHPAGGEAALWFHDAIYEVKQRHNEECSASWARAALLRAAAPAASASRVQGLVLATKHSALPEAPDEQLLVDIDLSILGAAEPRFAEYEQQIRQEYSFVPELTLRQRRRAILRSFLDRECIYSTGYFRAALEQRARANLVRAVGAS